MALPNPMLDLAADRLTSGAHEARGPDEEPVFEFLTNIGYLDPSATVAPDPQSVAHRVCLLRAAARMERLFVLPTPNAPNLTVMGGVVRPSMFGDQLSEAPPGSITGSGTSLGAAFEACIGEGLEYVSQFAQGDDLVTPGPGADVIDPFPTAHPPVGIDRAGGFVAGRHLTTGDAVFLPASRCLRPVSANPASASPASTSPASAFALSTGCGAGNDFEMAALHGLFEVLERDALALWWRGGRPARPVAMDAPGVSAAVSYLSHLRGGSSDRHAWFLDITTDLGIPCVAAVSVDGDGRRVACGTACRTDVATALMSATREMCQMEMAYAVVDAKEREMGDAGLNETDRRHKQRAQAIDADACPLLHPKGTPAAHDPIAGDQAAAAEVLSALGRHLDRMSVQVFLVDLTRSMVGIPVVRVVAPALQLDPCQIETVRLQKQTSLTGGASNPISLM